MTKDAEYHLFCFKFMLSEFQYWKLIKVACIWKFTISRHRMAHASKGIPLTDFIGIMKYQLGLFQQLAISLLTELLMVFCELNSIITI